MSGRPVPGRLFWKDTLAQLLGMQDHRGIVSLSLHLEPGAPVMVKTEQFVLDDAGLKQRQIIQHDRFATYEATDMEWAEPLGLAEWGDGVAMSQKRYQLVEVER